MQQQLGHKNCPKCGETQPLEEFGRDRSRRDGLSCWCRKCCLASSVRNKRNNPEKTMFYALSGRARRKGIPFNLTLDDFKIPKKCPLLGIDIYTNRRLSGNSPSVDRINPSLGYVKGNVWIISVRANSIKSNASLEEIEKLALNLRKFLNERTSSLSH